VVRQAPRQGEVTPSSLKMKRPGLMPRPFDFIELVLERTSNRCAAVSAVSEVVGAFDQLELANKLSKSYQGHRCWFDPGRLFKNGACRAKGRPEIASTRRTYPPPCPPPQGGRQGDTNHESFFDLQKEERTKRPGINACFFFNRAFPKPFPPPLWGRAGWGVPKNKIAAGKKNGFLPPENRTARLV